MRFAYGQIIKKRHFVRKIRVNSWCISQNKKKSAPSLARISNHCSVVAFGSTPCIIRFQLAFPLSQARTPWTRRARLRSPKACVRAHDRSLPHLHNQAQTSNKAHDKFVPRRDCACADRSRPSLSTALLSGWSSHLV